MKKNRMIWSFLHSCFHWVFILLVVVATLFVFFRSKNLSQDVGDVQREKNSFSVSTEYVLHEKLYKNYENRIESAENKLTLWATTLTVAFVAFTLLGLLEIDKRIKIARENADEIDSKNKEVFSTFALVKFLRAMSEDYSPFVESTFEYLISCEKKRKDDSKSYALQFFLYSEKARALQDLGRNTQALELYDKVIQDVHFREQDELLKSLMYYRRGRVYFRRGKEKRGEEAKEDWFKAIDDYQMAKKFAWDARSHAFFCVEMGEVWLSISTETFFNEREYRTAESCFDDAKGIYPQTFNIDRLLGLYWEERWTCCRKGDLKYCKTAIKFFKQVEKEIMNNSTKEVLNHDKILNRKLKHARRHISRLEREKNIFLKRVNADHAQQEI